MQEMFDKLHNLNYSLTTLSFAIKEMARKNGMMTMLEDGLQKALDGKTSLHELIEVLGSTRDV